MNVHRAVVPIPRKIEHKNEKKKKLLVNSWWQTYRCEKSENAANSAFKSIIIHKLAILTFAKKMRNAFVTAYWSCSWWNERNEKSRMRHHSIAGKYRTMGHEEEKRATSSHSPSIRSTRHSLCSFSILTAIAFSLFNLTYYSNRVHFYAANDMLPRHRRCVCPWRGTHAKESQSGGIELAFEDWLHFVPYFFPPFSYICLCGSVSEWVWAGCSHST